MFTLDRKMKSAQVAAATHLWRKHTLSRSFFGWTEETKKARAQNATATMKYNAKADLLKTQCFLSWKEVTKHLRVIQFQIHSSEFYDCR